MRALNVTAPWGLDAIQVVEKPDPTPGAGQVLVRMKAVSLNYRDLLMVNGMYGRGAASTADVITPFSDGCGVIEAVGAGALAIGGDAGALASALAGGTIASSIR